MTALAEALLAAQRQAIGALAKPYVADVIGDEAVTARLKEIGCVDPVDTAQLLAAWDVLREYGAPAPKPATNGDGPKMISPGQKPYIRDLFRKANIDPLPDADVDALTFAKASELIDALKNGTYDPAEYTVPF